CLGVLAAAQARDDEALAHFREGLQIALAGGHLLSQVEALEGIAGVLSRRGDAQRASRWLAVTEAARETLGAPVAPVEREGYDQVTQRLLATLGAETYATLRAGAAGLSLEQMIVETLGPAQDGTAAPARAAAPVT